MLSAFNAPCRRGVTSAPFPDIEEATFSLRVQIDNGQEVALPGSYIDDGNVALGYAMTVHKSQGMSVDQAYVLGGQGL